MAAGSQSTMNAAPDSGNNRYAAGCHNRSTISENAVPAPINNARLAPNQASMSQPNTTWRRSTGVGIKPTKMNSSDRTMKEEVAPPISKAMRVSSTSIG